MRALSTLHARIMAPFMTLFLAVVLVSLAIDRHYVSRLMDERVLRQTDRLSRVLSNSEFVLNPVYLDKLKEVIEGDLIVFEKSGTVAASTLSGEMLRSLGAEINARSLFSSLKKGGGEVLRTLLTEDANPSLMTSRRLDGVEPGKEMVLCIITPLTDVIAAKSRITRLMFLVAFGGLLLTALLGYLISRSVTRPIHQLVSVTESIAAGDMESRASLPPVEELKRLAVSINTMTLKLKESDEQVRRSCHLAAAGKVTAAMAHEIRNPLSSVKMLTQLLRDRISDPENNRMIGFLLEEVSRLERIVNDLTDLMRPSEIRLAHEDIHGLLEEILEVVSPKLAHRRIGLVKDFQGSISPVRIDRDKIKQVIWNILLNAMDGMHAGGVVRVATAEKQADRTVEVVIEDEGPGIPDGIRDRIFEPFFTTKPEGLGLGLFTCREIIERHGGRLTLENMAQTGARVVISLPA